jgi:brefeldin A-inhibited guanine nucleotide-exchange protein
LQQLLENNVSKLSPSRWERVTTTFVRLFRTTTPYQLFDESLRVEIDASSEAMESNSGIYTSLILVLVYSDFV